jgi:hypothetical protein
MDDKASCNRAMARMKERDYLDWVYEENKSDLIDILISMFIVVMGIITSYLLLLKIFGHSPITEIVMGAIATIIAGGILMLHKEFGKFSEFVETTKNSFKVVKDDVGEVKSDLKETKRDIKDFRQELTTFKISTSDDLTSIKADIKIIKSGI